MKNKIIELIFWFLVGFTVVAGMKTMDAIWPDKPMQIEYTIKETK